MPSRENHRYNKWSEFEDEALIKLTNQNGCRKWKLISKLMREQEGIQNRTGKQCRERWLNHLNLENRKFVWTEDEDRKLFQLYGQIGTKWCEIVKHFPNNCDSFIKNRFYSLARKSIRKMCKYSSIKTNSLNIYSIKPATLAFILNEGGGKHHTFQRLSRIAGNQQTQDYYKAISQLIKIFIFKRKEENQCLPTPKTVIWALKQIIEVDQFHSSPRDKYRICEKESSSFMNDQIYSDANSFQDSFAPLQEEKVLKREKKRTQMKLFKTGKIKNRARKNSVKRHKQTVLECSEMENSSSNIIEPQLFLQSFRDISKQDIHNGIIPNKMMMIQLLDEYQAQEDSFVRELNEDDKKILIFKVQN